MSGGFYVGSGQRAFEIPARIWAVVMAGSLLAGIALTITARRTGVSRSRGARRDDAGK